MPDSFGKRQRRDVKAKKAVAREERRLARNQRREDRAAGIIEPGSPLGEAHETGVNVLPDAAFDEDE